jgi:DNA-binding MarR family transcriptional regulator
MSNDDKIADRVLTTIRQIVRRISEHSKYLSREVGLTVPQLMCLRAIGELDDGEREITVAMVAGIVQLSPATVSRIIDRLARAGLVDRQRRSVDRRRVCLSLTPAGLDRFQTLPVPLQEKFVTRLHALSEAERQTILASLKRIAAMMDATELDAAPMLTPGSDVKGDESAF